MPDTPEMPPLSTGMIKWHPSAGYVWPSSYIQAGGGDLATVESYINSTCSDPNIKGLQVFFWWGTFEQTAGVYDWTLLDQIIGELGMSP
jgi:hypothetical protein